MYTKWLLKQGIMPKVFPVLSSEAPLIKTLELGNAANISSDFNKGGKISPFENSGVMINGVVHTVRTDPQYEGSRALLKHVLIKEKDVPEEYFISKSKIPEWKRQKGGKKETRKSKSGFEYEYSEGSMAFPDSLDKPSRTIVTGEGGSTASRFKHIIQTSSGRYRRLTPLELERLNMFPDNHTAGASDNRRAFFMGNALVVGIVERLGKELAKRVSED